MDCPMIAIIVLNYNNAADTINCIESIVNCKGSEQHSLILVDNDSNDGSYQQIENHFTQKGHSFNKPTLENQNGIMLSNMPFITSVKAGSNKGYAGGNNIGLKLALQDKNVQFCWVLNNDTDIREDCIENICSYLLFKLKDKEGIIGTLILQQQNRSLLQLLSAKYYPFVGKSKSLLPNYDSKLVDETLIDKVLPQTDYLLGASIIFRKSLLEEIGIFNEAYY
jgi:GT2 family glycosyltransferase